MLVTYYVKRTAICLSSNSNLNGEPINIEDFISRTSNGWEEVLIVPTVTKRYRISHHEAKAFAKILVDIFNQPFDKNKEFKGTL